MSIMGCGGKSGTGDENTGISVLVTSNNVSRGAFGTGKDGL